MSLTKISVAPRDARILGSILALGTRGEFVVKHVVTLAKALGDLRSESTIQAKAREILKQLVEMGVLNVTEEARRKKYSLAISQEELKEKIPAYVERAYQEALEKLEKGEVVLEEVKTTRGRKKKKVEPSLTLDRFFS